MKSGVIIFIFMSTFFSLNAQNSPGIEFRDSLVIPSYPKKVYSVKKDLIQHELFEFLKDQFSNWDELILFKEKFGFDKMIDLVTCLQLDSTELYFCLVTIPGSENRMKIAFDYEKKKKYILYYGSSWVEKSNLTEINRLLKNSKFKNLDESTKNSIFISNFKTSKYTSKKIDFNDSLYLKLKTEIGSELMNEPYQLSSKWDSLDYVIYVTEHKKKFSYQLFLAQDGKLIPTDDIVRWNDNIEGFRLEKRKGKYFAILPEIP